MRTFMSRNPVGPRSGLLVLLALTGCATKAAGPAPAQAPAPTTTAAPTPGGQAPGTPGQAPAGGARPGGPGAPQTGPRPYREVITDKARSDSGLFTVHQVADKWYYEVPVRLYDKEMLLVTRRTKTPQNIGFGGEEENEGVVRWQRQGERILLRYVAYDNVAADSLPIAMAVRVSNFEPVLFAFPIAAFKPDSSAVVIDVTPMFTTDVPVLGLSQQRRTAYQVRTLDPARSYVVAIHSYPTNIEARHVLTYGAGLAPSSAETGTISLEMNQSMVVLPERPMMARLNDDRVGYFGVQQTDYGRPAQKSEIRRYISRWRLEPKDPAAFARGELVDPVKQVVYYVDPATPVQWRSCIKQGIDDWQGAFEAAGFRRAIVGKDPPTAAEDPEFSLEDARYSVVRYFASPIQNAYGPHVSDPRTGEILESHIGWYHNVMSLLRNWFLIQTAAVNPAARRPQFEDALMCQLIRFVSSHEVGHTLGLPHNMKASSSYPVDSLRVGDFTKRMHTAPSIMDYARFNYVAQPGDTGISYYPGIGVYDTYSIRWGYRPIPGAATPDAEKATLDRWIKEHEGDPRYRFGDPSQVDPSAQTEDLGDDGVKASNYGLANLKRIVPQLRTWTTSPGEDYNDLQELYDNVIGQWARYTGHVTTIVGGVNEVRKSSDQAGAVYTIVPKARQQAAVAWLSENVFATPTWIIDPEILGRLENNGIVERVRARQVTSLNNLLDPVRMGRLIEQQAKLGDRAYSLSDLFRDVRRGVFGDLSGGPTPDTYKRNLQRGYVDRMSFLMTSEPPSPPPGIPAQFLVFFPRMNVSQSDIRALARAELETLERESGAAASRAANPLIKAHYHDLAIRIGRILNPNR
jgi:hypothetical protein